MCQFQQTVLLVRTYVLATCMHTATTQHSGSRERQGVESKSERTKERKEMEEKGCGKEGTERLNTAE